MRKLDQLCEGKDKRVFNTDDPHIVLVEFKDDMTAMNGFKHAAVAGKGMVNNRVNNALMSMLSRNGIPTHFVEEISDRETLVRRADVLPVKIIVRNIASGTLCERLNVPEGTPLKHTVLEYSCRDDELGRPLVNADQILVKGWISKDLLDQASRYALRINDLLKAYFHDLDCDLVDCRLEFGVTDDGSLILVDEISPDTCRIWDSRTHEKLDKDRFRENLGGIGAAYQEIMKRVLGE